MKNRYLLACASFLLLAMNTPADPPILSPDDVTLTAAEKAELKTGLQPDSWFAERLHGPRIRIDGQRLDAKLQFLKDMAGDEKPEREDDLLAAFDTPQERAAMRADTDRRWTIRSAITANMAVEDRTIPGRGGAIPVRIYRPKTDEDGPLPVLVYYHGGGFVFASIRAVDRQVRLIANEARAIVVSVDYRLAPEHPFPAPQNDAEDAFLWVRANAASLGGDPERIGVGGDSAGGHLALVTSLRQRAAGRPGPLFQLLYYPAVTLEQADRSYALFGEGYGLDLGFINAVTKLAFPDPASWKAPATWALAEPSLAGMPATIVATAGYDPLRDQGRKLAEKLEKDGVSVVYLNYASLTHSFLNWSGVIEDANSAARETASLFGQAIRSRRISAPPAE